MKKLAVILLLLCACSAQQVPRSDIEFVSKNWNARLRLPKDEKVKGFHAVVNADGTVDVTIAELNALTNPDVVATSGEATAKAIEASGNLIMKGVDSGIEIGKKLVK